MALPLRFQTVIARASADTVTNSFDDLHANFGGGSFLSSSNYLSNSPVDTIETQANIVPIKRRKLLGKYSCEYIASSALLHNLDGWNYFGYGVNCILKGDNHTSRHLLYYSELRGVMSILASFGIGVFNNRHIIVDSKRKMKYVNAPTPITNDRSNKSGTHQFTWEAIDHLFGDAKVQMKFLKRISVDSISFYDWLDAFSINDSHKLSIATVLLKRLTIDLNTFANDRDARNEVSYRPYGFMNKFGIAGIDVLKQVHEIWAFSEPIGNDGEFKLDFYLLRELLQSSFKHVHPHEKSFKNAILQYRRRLNTMLNALPLGNERKSELLELFCKQETDFYDTLGITDFSDIKFTRAMLYRSLLVSRFSSLFCNQILKDSPSVDKSNLEFWWKGVGQELGLWPAAAIPADFADLWQDFALATEKMQELIQTNPGISIYELIEKPSDFGFHLCSSSKIALWGTGL
ncbi:MAG TPA: hypothetical protein DIT07_02185 [Sphingobacteriaceae bacterium]|nr:hypothetical protein [Sphingobacteriaceae bacterium]